MHSILKKMQSTVIKYANVLSEVLKVDIEIVDNNLERIAGTGKYAQKINTNMSDEGYVYKTVLETGEKQIINEPGSSHHCYKCPKRNNCDETFELSMPIRLNTQVIGVIGLVCFNQYQKKHIMLNLNSFSNFLEQIADLIASKAKEELDNEKKYEILSIFEKYMDKMDDAVLVLDHNNNLKRMNNTFALLTGINNPSAVKQISIKETGEYVLSKREYALIVNNKSYFVAGEEHIISLDNFKYNKIFTFNTTERMIADISSIANAGKDIGIDEIIGECKEILYLKDRVKKISSFSSTVLITGESGTGKELFARAIHLNSTRAKYPFVAINCGAIPDSLLESELFGYVRGAFTGADPKGKIGKFELADKGTIFLDEIGDLPLYMQVKVLRVLQERKIVKLGSNDSIDIDVRIIAATNKNLEKMIEEKNFREDLYYRINVIPIQIPPLREREDDIKILTHYFIDKYSKLFNKKVKKVDESVWEYFSRYDWPGNVRELENTVEFMINMMDERGSLSADILPRRVLNHNNESLSFEEDFNLRRIEKNIIKRVVERYGCSLEGKKLAANKLGIGIATLYRKMETYKLSK